MNLQSFQAKISQERLESAIHPDLVAANIRIVSDLEIGAGNEPEYPIHEALNWNINAKGFSRRETFYAALFTNEDGSTWQAKISNPIQDKKTGKPRKYESPKGIGSKVFKPSVPASIRKLIGDRYGVEVPLEGSFWDWVESNPQLQVIVTEGGKKALSLLSLGFIAVSLYGVSSGYGTKETGKPKLNTELAALAGNKRPIVIAFDQDTKQSTRRNVGNAARKLSEVIENAALMMQRDVVISVASWHPEAGKGIDDLCYQSGTEAVETAIASAVEFNRYLGNVYTSLNYLPSESLCSRYFGAIAIPENERFIALKGGKGTGKTEVIADYVKKALEDGYRIVLLSHRVQLLEALCQRLELLSIDALNAMSMEQKRQYLEHYGISLCVDSLHPLSKANFNAEQWGDRVVVVIDEIEQVLSHLLQSSTCKKERTKILDQFYKLTRSTLDPETDSKLLIADADLSDLSIDLIRDLAEDEGLKPYLITNTYKAANRRRAYFYGTKEQWRSNLYSFLGDDKKLMITTDSQKPGKAYSSTSLEKDITKRFPDLRVLRIDSETLSLRNHAAFGALASINELVIDYDVIICSPSVETGISIDVKNHFDAVFSMFQGVQAENSVRQTPERLRDDVDRHLFVADRAIDAYSKEQGLTSHRAIIHSNNKSFEMLKAQLHGAFSEGLELNAAYAAFGECYAKIVARENIGGHALKQTVMAGMIADGYEVIEVAESLAKAEKDAIKQEAKAIAELTGKESRENVAGANLIDHQVYELRKNRPSFNNEAESCETKKYRIFERYMVEVTPELVEKDGDGYYSKLNLHYFCTVGRDRVGKRDKGYLEGLSNQGQSFTPDANRSALSLKVGTLEALEVIALIDIKKDCELSDYDPDLIALAERAKRYSFRIKECLNITIKPDTDEKLGDSPIKVFRTFLDLLGITLERLNKRVGGMGKQKWVYRIAGLDDERVEIFPRWQERDERIEASKAEESIDIFGSNIINPSIDILTIDSSSTVDPTENAYLSPDCIADIGMMLDEWHDSQDAYIGEFLKTFPAEALARAEAWRSQAIRQTALI